MNKAQRRRRDEYLRAAEMIESRAEEFSCNAIDRTAGYYARNDYVQTMGKRHGRNDGRRELWIEDVVRAALGPVGKWQGYMNDPITAEKVRGLRVMLLSLMAWSVADLGLVK